MKRFLGTKEFGRYTYICDRGRRRTNTVTYIRNGFLSHICSKSIHITAALDVDKEYGSPNVEKANACSLKVITYNTLAPCYFRSNGIYEATSLPSAWSRHRCIINVLREQAAEVCCLQEFWFNEHLRNLYEKELGDMYTIHSLKRTRSEDGVAILVAKDRLHVAGQYDISFRDYSQFGHDRVALVVIVQLESKEFSSGESTANDNSTEEKYSPPLAFVTSHLTYPHHTLDEYSRLEQSKVMVEEAKRYIQEICPPQTPIVISGDFNGPSDDAVSDQMRDSGYLDAFTDATGDMSSRITHCDHRKEQKGVDYIWLSHSNMKTDDNILEEEVDLKAYDPNVNIKLKPIEAYLLPRNIPADARMQRPSFAKAVDNSADESELEIIEVIEHEGAAAPVDELCWDDWCNMSDHRPMVAVFDAKSSK